MSDEFEDLIWGHEHVERKFAELQPEIAARYKALEAKISQHAAAFSRALVAEDDEDLSHAMQFIELTRLTAADFKEWQIYRRARLRFMEKYSGPVFMRVTSEAAQMRDTIPRDRNEGRNADEDRELLREIERLKPVKT